MKTLKALWLIPLLFMFGFIFGCADSSQTGLDKKTEVLIKIKVVQEAGNQGNVHISPTGELKSIMGDTDQESAAVAEAQAQFKIPVAQQGGQANIESDTVDAAAKQDNRKTNSDNPVNSETTNNNTSPGVGKPENQIFETDIPEVAWGKMPYSHTQLNGSDKDKVTGKMVSVVLCPGDNTRFDSCSQGNVDIPYHGMDPDSEGRDRLSYWNMTESGTGDIVCTLDGQEYRFRTKEGGVLKGDC